MVESSFTVFPIYQSKFTTMVLDMALFTHSVLIGAVEAVEFVELFLD